MKKNLLTNKRYRFKAKVIDKSIRATRGKYEEIYIIDNIKILDNNVKLHQTMQLIESQATRKLQPNINDIIELNAKLIQLGDQYKVTYLTNVKNHTRPCNDKVEMCYQTKKEKPIKDTNATDKQIELMNEMCEFLGLENPNITDSTLITKWFYNIKKQYPRISYDLKKYRKERELNSYKIFN